MAKNIQKQRREKINNPYKALCLIILGVLMLNLIGIPLISGAEFDNVKKIKGGTGVEGYPDIDVENWFGIGAVLWSGSLKYNTKICSEECIARTDINLPSGGSLVDDIKFRTLKEDGTWVEQDIRSYKLYIEVKETQIEVPEYEEECEMVEILPNGTNRNECYQVQIGTQFIDSEEWVEYTLGQELPAGDYTLKLVGEKKPERTVDWIIKTRGEWLDEWAEWGSSGLGVGLVAYWDFENDGVDQTGENDLAGVNTPAFDTGIIDTATNLVPNDYWDGNLVKTTLNIKGDQTINFWMNNPSYASREFVLRSEGNAGGILHYRASWESSTTMEIFVEGRDIASVPNFGTGRWIMVTILSNDTGVYAYINGTFQSKTEGARIDSLVASKFFIGTQSAANNQYSGLVDEFAMWNRTLTAFEISQIYGDGAGLGFGVAPPVAELVTLNAPPDNNVTSNSAVVFNCSLTLLGGATVVNISLWTNQTGTWVLNETEDFTGVGGAKNYSIFNKNIVEGVIDWTCRGFDTDGDSAWGTNRTLTVDTSPPIITVNLPTAISDYGYVGKVEQLNYSIVESSLNSLWYNYRGANTTITGLVNYTNFTLVASPFNLTLYANDSLGNIGSVFREWEYQVFENSQTFVTPTTSGVINAFILNVTTNGDIITIGALNYNGTNLLGSISSNGNNYILSRNQITPGVNELTNISFFWNLTLDTGSNIDSRTDIQTITPIGVNETCGANMYVVYNFTMVDEKTQVKLNGSIENTSMKIDLSLYTSDRTLKLLDFSRSFLEINSVAVCINSNLSGGETYSIDTQIEYKADGYSTELYNLEREALSNSTLVQNITLYDLDTPNTQDFRLLVRDTSYLPIDGGLIQIERKYIENGTFFITEIPKTDEAGITSASLEVDDVIYNFNIYDAGVLVSSFTNVIAICQTPLVSQCEIDFNAFQSSITIPNYEEGDDFNFTLVYNDTSRVITSQFVIPSGEPSLVELVITSEDTLGTSVCSDSLTSASGTLSCTVPSNFGNSTVTAKLFKDSVEQGKGNVKLDQNSKDIFGVILVFLSVLVIMTLIGVGVSDNPVVTGVFLFVGVMLLFGINLVQNTGFYGRSATILFFAIAVILVIIKASRRS